MISEPDWLSRAVARGCAQTWTLAWLFSQYKGIENATDSDIACELACSPEQLRWLQLCRIPRRDEFFSDIKMLSQRLGFDVDKVTSLIRRIEALLALSNPQGVIPVLMAARDREDDRS